MSAARDSGRSAPGRILALPVRAYRRWISPLKPPTCRFHPTCSAYAIEALELHGAFKGMRLSLWRVLRCQPLCKPGFDPVPGSELELARRACDSAPDVDTPRPTSAPLAPSPPARPPPSR